MRTIRDGILIATDLFTENPIRIDRGKESPNFGTLVIDRGRAALSGSADIVSKDPKVREAYLGKLWEQQSLATTLEFV